MRTFVKLNNVMVLSFAMLLTGCTGNSTAISSLSPTSADSVSANYICQKVGEIVVGYDDYLAYWRNTQNNVPYEELFSYSDDAVTKLQDISNEVSAKGIDWDSTAIVSNFILNISDGIEEISYSTQNRFFQPGRDLNTILQDIALSAESVLNSACK